MLNNKEAIKQIKAINKTWKISLIEIISINKSYYNNGGYWIDIIKFMYKGVNYQFNYDMQDDVIFKLK